MVDRGGRVNGVFGLVALLLDHAHTAIGECRSGTDVSLLRILNIELTDRFDHLELLGGEARRLMILLLLIRAIRVGMVLCRLILAVLRDLLEPILGRCIIDLLITVRDVALRRLLS